MTQKRIRRKAVKQKEEVMQLLDIEEFKEVVSLIQRNTGSQKVEHISKLLSLPGLTRHYECGNPRRLVLSEFQKFDFDHERGTACKLAENGYNVLFVPKGFFNKDSKKFDVFLNKGTAFFNVELKCITSPKPDTIAKRIKEGSGQATRVALDIMSNINIKTLIDGLRSGCERNDNLLEIILIFQSQCYFLPKEKILSNKIYKEIKLKKP